MNEAQAPLTLGPARALALELPHLPGALRRATLRSLLALSGGAVRIEGADRLAESPTPAIFALTHHNTWESVLAPAALVALRRGRLIRFLVDWMFVDLPWTGWLVRQIDPLPLYTKPARFRLREARRLARRRDSAIDALVCALARGEDVGLYPEGRRNGDPWTLATLRRGVAYLALRSGVPVVPVGIDFPARDRLRRTPVVGRFVLRIGEPVDFAEERAAWLATPAGRARRMVERRLAPAMLESLRGELSRLARKVHIPAEGARDTAREPSTQPAPTSRRHCEVVRVESVTERREALAVVSDVYLAEKRWISDPALEIPADPAGDPKVSWFLARSGGEPVGVLKLSYDPPLALPPEAEAELDAGIDLDRLARSGRFVEVGRLMIRERWRHRPAVVLELMRGAVGEVVSRGYTHLLTAVFEDDPHSPYGFHTRQLGFERIGTHRYGELSCASRRILLVLDLVRSYRRMRERGQGLVGRLTRGFEEPFEKLARRAAS